MCFSVLHNEDASTTFVAVRVAYTSLSPPVSNGFKFLQMRSRADGSNINARAHQELASEG